MVAELKTEERSYLPAAGRDWALPFYDPLVKLLGANTVRSVLLQQADMAGTRRVLDIGCGTGTFATALKQAYPTAEIIGLDPDPNALARSRRKAERAGVTVQFDQGFSDELPYPDSSFDRVFSSFMFHHLQKGQREKTLREVRRVLAPGGSFHLVDFERADAHNRGWMARIHSSHHLQDNSENRLLALMREAGFDSPTRVGGRTMLLGLLRVGYYKGSVR